MSSEDDQASWLYVLIGVCVALVAIAFARLSYGVVLPYMREGLSLSYQEAGILGTMTSLGYLVAILFAGILTTKWGEKQTVLLGMSMVTIGFINLSFTPSYLFSIFYMILLGMGTALIFTPLVSLLTGWFPSRKGLVIGYLNSGAGLGILFSGFLLPGLNQMLPGLEWRISWGVFAFVSMFVLILTFAFMRNRPESQVKTGEITYPSVQVYKEPKIILIGMIYGIVGHTFIIQATFMMSFMVESGISGGLAGTLIAINGILAVFSAPIVGGISDRIGRHRALFWTMCLNFSATFAVVLYPNMLGFMFNQIIIGVMATGIFTLVQALSTELVHSKHTPVVFSYVTFYFAIGQLVGPTAAGWLIDWGGFRYAFLFSSLILAIGVLLVTRMKADEAIIIMDGKKAEQ